MLTRGVWRADSDGEFSVPFQPVCRDAKSPFAVVVGDWAACDRIILRSAVPAKMTFRLAFKNLIQ